MLQLLLQPLWLIDLYQFLSFSLISVDRNNDSNVLDNIEAEESVVMTADTGASVAELQYQILVCIVLFFVTLQ